MKFEITISDEYCKELDVDAALWPGLIQEWIVTGADALSEEFGGLREERYDQIEVERVAAESRQSKSLEECLQAPL